MIESAVRLVNARGRKDKKAPEAWNKARRSPATVSRVGIVPLNFGRVVEPRASRLFGRSRELERRLVAVSWHFRTRIRRAQIRDCGNETEMRVLKPGARVRRVGREDELFGRLGDQRGGGPGHGQVERAHAQGGAGGRTGRLLGVHPGRARPVQIARAVPRRSGRTDLRGAAR